MRVNFLMPFRLPFLFTNIAYKQWSVYDHIVVYMNRLLEIKILEVKRTPRLAEVFNTIIIWYVKEKILRGK